MYGIIDCNNFYASNLSLNEEKALKIVAKALLAYTDNEINTCLHEEGTLFEVKNE
ncbi:MAG: hypothetical protein H2069_10255 [Legionella sp.]|nr:hypothetical protein [Legionella sp.]